MAIIKRNFIEITFIVLCLVFGTLFAFSNGPFQSPDEYVHFYRVYQISSGHIFGETLKGKNGAYVPKAVIDSANKVSENVPMHPNIKINVKNLKKELKVPINNNKKMKFYYFTNSSLYSPIVYIPQVVGMLIGRMLNLSTITILYISRLLNLICYAVLILASMKLLNNKKLLISVFALSPMILYQAASVSADALTNGLAIFTLCYFLQFYYDKDKKISNKEIVIMFLLVIMMSLCKQIYFLFALLFFVIPREKIENKKLYYVLPICMLFLGVIVTYVWSALTHGNPTTHPEAGANASKQVAYILENPVEYIKVFLRTARIECVNLVKEFVGKLGWLDTDLPIYIPAVYLILFVLAALVNTKKSISNKLKILLLVIFCSFVVLTFTALYVSFTPVKAITIIGIQGRYFIPVALMFFLVFDKSHFNIKYLDKVSFVLILFCLIKVEQVLLERFYGINIF